MKSLLPIDNVAFALGLTACKHFCRIAIGAGEDKMSISQVAKLEDAL